MEGLVVIWQGAAVSAGATFIVLLSMDQPVAAVSTSRRTLFVVGAEALGSEESVLGVGMACLGHGGASLSVSLVVLASSSTIASSVLVPDIFFISMLWSTLLFKMINVALQ